MRLSAKERESLSKRRKSLNEELVVWKQREKDAEVWPGLSKQDRAEKILFCRQEQAKLQRKLKDLDFGFRKQRAWSQGKLLY